MDVIERTPINTPAARALHEKMQQKLVEHANYIAENGIDLPEVRNWEWPH
jgi:xylulose-5-phosphate/fructose-6-phosphate phosphoketolase